MHVDVDKAGGDHPSRGIHHLVRRRLLPGHQSHPAVLQQQVQSGLDPVARVDDQTIFNERFHGQEIAFRPARPQNGRGRFFTMLKGKSVFVKGNDAPQGLFVAFRTKREEKAGKNW